VPFHKMCIHRKNRDVCATHVIPIPRSGRGICFIFIQRRTKQSDRQGVFFMPWLQAARNWRGRRAKFVVEMWWKYGKIV